MKPGTRPLDRVNPQAGFNNYGCKAQVLDLKPRRPKAYKFIHSPKPKYK